MVSFVLIASISYAKEIKEIKVKTSAQCETCKPTIEKAIKKLSGIVSAKLNLKTKDAEVKYDADETTPEKIKKAISLAGYDADELKADAKAYKKLPKCCQKGGHDN
jgi:copper chaperone CopZ